MDRYEILYRNIVHHWPVGFSIVDRNGNIEEFNRGAEEITGFRRDEVIGRPHLEVLHGTEDEEACPLLGQALKYHKETVSTEAVIQSKSGERITVMVTALPLYGRNNEFSGGVELFRDVTVEKRLERERKNFLSMFVHDMKNPLVAAKGLLSRVSSGKAGPLNEEQMDFLSTVVESMEKMEALVLEFLEFSRFESKTYVPVLAPVDLVTIIQRNIKELQVEAERKGVSIVCEVEGRDFTVEGDEKMLDRVFTNLLNNAVKYTPPDSAITVRCAEYAKSCRVQVINPGADIPEEELPYLFDAFHRVSREGRGVGLGLAIAQKIVDLHGGTIKADLLPNNEIAFVLTLFKGKR